MDVMAGKPNFDDAHPQAANAVPKPMNERRLRFFIDFSLFPFPLGNMTHPDMTTFRLHSIKCRSVPQGTFRHFN